MKTEYSITLNVKTGADVQCFGQFFIGNDHRKARTLFSQLHGLSHLDSHEVIYMDLVETSNGLPVTIDVCACTLTQLGENCQFITKELFKRNIFSFT
jgi:hypothetical protein